MESSIHLFSESAYEGANTLQNNSYGKSVTKAAGSLLHWSHIICNWTCKCSEWVEDKDVHSLNCFQYWAYFYPGIYRLSLCIIWCHLAWELQWKVWLSDLSVITLCFLCFMYACVWWTTTTWGSDIALGCLYSSSYLSSLHPNYSAYDFICVYCHVQAQMWLYATV